MKLSFVLFKKKNKTQPKILNKQTLTYFERLMRNVAFILNDSF